MKKILFSPIGGTDPIANFRDGAMLHTVRYVKPDKIVLFLSAEMYKHHKEDNRYLYCLNRLLEQMKLSAEVELIVDEELVDVHLFDLFYNEFKERLDEIHSRLTDTDEIYVNTSSGTPAMKSALLTLAVISDYRIIPLQVSTPVKQQNDHLEDKNAYNPEEYWDMNDDNNPQLFVNRCEKVRAGNLVTLLQKDMIKRHILSYDYIAAMNIARTMDLSIRNDIVNLLEAAAGRLQLNFAKVKAYSQYKKYSMLIAKNEEEQKLIEYILALEIKIKKRELADFVRAITPAVLELFKRILEVNCSLRIDDYLRKDAADAALKWDVDALNQTELEDALNKRYNGFRGGIVYSAHFEVLIKQYADKDVIRRASKMVGVEQNVRNMAAHNMASVSDKDILSLTSHHGMPGMNAKQIYELLQQLTDDAGITMTKADWNSYDIMNQKMISYIDTITLD